MVCRRVVAALIVLCSLMSRSTQTAATNDMDHNMKDHSMEDHSMDHNMDHGMHGDHMENMDHHSMMMQAFENDEQCPSRCYEEFKKSLTLSRRRLSTSTADNFQLLIQRWCKDANVPGFKLNLSNTREEKNCQKDRLVEQKDGPAVALWATLPYSSFQLRRSSILLDSCITGSLGLQSSCWPYGPMRTNLAAVALRNETRRA